MFSVLRTKTVTAKIDQMQRKVIISATTHRTFGRQQWQVLHQTLLQWQGNLNSVQTSLRALELMQTQALPQ